jgi:hypothetical protein
MSSATAEATYALIAELPLQIESHSLEPLRRVLAPHASRITWDAPLRSLADIPGLDHKPRAINIKHPDTPNDVAPSGYNRPEFDASLPTSPLTATPAPTGFRWA